MQPTPEPARSLRPAELDPVREIDLETETQPDEEDELPNVRPVVAIAAVAGLVFTCFGLGLWWWRSLDSGDPVTNAAGAVAAGGTGANPGGSGATSGDRLRVKIAPISRGTLSDVSEVSGSIVPTPSAALRAAAPGTIVSVAVRSGQTVKKGDLLMQVRLPATSNPQTLQAADQAKRLEQGLEEIQSAMGQITTEIELQASERSTLNQELATRQQALASQEKNLAQLRGMTTEGALGRQQVQQAQRNRDQAAADVAAVQKQQVTLDRELAALRDRLRQFQSQAATVQTRLGQARSIARGPNSTTTLVPVNSPAAGTIASVPVKPSQTVSSGQPLVTLTGEPGFRVQLKIPSDRSANLKTGLALQVTDEQGKILGVGQIVVVDGNGATPNAGNSSQNDTASAKTSTKPTDSNRSATAKVGQDGETNTTNPGSSLEREALAIVPRPLSQPTVGQTVKARVLWQQRPEAIVAPKAALVGPDDNRAVFVLERGETGWSVRRRAVKVGLVRDTYVEILSGLTDRDAVAVDQLAQLKEGQAIEPVLDRPPAATAPATPPALNSPAAPGLNSAPIAPLPQEKTEETRPQETRPPETTKGLLVPPEKAPDRSPVNPGQIPANGSPDGSPKGSSEDSPD